MNSFKKGFTLIELLVVIAIMGILAGIVIVFISSSRQKGNLAGIQTQLATITRLVEVANNPATGYGMMTGTFANCSNAIAGTGSNGAVNTMFNDSSVEISTILTDVLASKVPPSELANSRCVIFPRTGSNPSNRWLISIPYGPAAYWCVDSNGNARSISTLPGVASVVCPAS